MKLIIIGIFVTVIALGTACAQASPSSETTSGVEKQSSEKDVFTSWYARYADSVSNTGIPIAEPLLAYDWYMEGAGLPVFPNFDTDVSSTDINDVLLKIIEHGDRRDRNVVTIRLIDHDRLSLDKSGDMYLLSLKSQE